MYAYLDGKLAEKQPTTVIIDCNGVGYELNIPLSTYDQLPAKGELAHLLVYYHFNETDGVKLFGFGTRQEKVLFKTLLGVSKIGPRTAIAVLSTLSVEEFERAVLEGNLNLIATVPGIGKKSAERLVLELKDRIGMEDSIIPDRIYGRSSVTEDALSALITLGYSQKDVRKYLSHLTKKYNYKSAEELIKATIKELHKKDR